MQIRTSIKYIFLTTILSLGMFFVASVSYAAMGTIVDGYQQSTFLDQDLNDDTFDDVINWKPDFGTAVTVSDTALAGDIWGESSGWIRLKCVESCGEDEGDDWGVTNTTGGVLAGYAWGQITGWISFSCANPTSTCTEENDNWKVTISPSTGEFSGYAWSQNYGWIKFACPGVDTDADADDYGDTCVKTSWRPPSGGGGSPGGVPIIPPGDTPPPSPTCEQSGTCSPTPTCQQTNTCSPVDQTCQQSGTCPQPDPTGCQTLGTCPPPDDICTGTNCNPPEDDCTGNNCNPLPVPNETFPPTPGGGGGNGGGGTGSIVRTVSDPIVRAATQFFSTIDDIFSLKGTAAQKVVSITGLIAVLFSIPFAFWRAILALFGYRRRHPWGTVFDSVTKAPLDPVHVVLQDMAGNIVATSLTDMDGRYGFSVDPGMYQIIVNKTNYLFPSIKLAGRSFDQVYSDLYFGGPITVTTKNEIIVKNIPMDPMGVDWNELKKRQERMTKFYSSQKLLFARIAFIVFCVGFLFSIVAFLGVPNVVNGIIVGVYVVLLIARQTVLHISPEGGVLDRMTGSPLAYAVVTISRPETGQVVLKKVTDVGGHYYAILPNDTYQVSVEKKNADETYTMVHTEKVPVTRGMLSKVFEI